MGASTVIVVAGVPDPVGASTDTVTNCNASGPGSLAAVVAGATSGDTVTFSSSLSACTDGLITLAGTIDIDTDLTITGPGAAALTVSGNNTVGVFAVAAGVTATISGLTIGSGGDNYDGGGVYNEGTLTIDDTTLMNDNSGIGGAISNVGGTLNVRDSTLTDDNADDLGGAIFNDGGSTASITDSILLDDGADAGGGLWNDGTATITDSTLSGDNAGNGGDGGGVLNYGTLVVSASTLSDNSGGGIVNGGVTSLAATIVVDSSSGEDCSGGVTDAGYNLDDDGSCGFSVADHSQSGVDPDLGFVENNGGPTLTQAPMPGSPALDQIPLGTTANGMSLCPGTDQRGVSRPQGPRCDLGAVELVPVSQAISSPNAVVTTSRSPFSFTVTTTGIPVPSLAEKGRLPNHVAFIADGEGTATISGTPRQPGVHHLTITATFSGTTTNVVTQTFTLTVVHR
jgi:hypothetical protein